VHREAPGDKSLVQLHWSGCCPGQRGNGLRLPRLAVPPQPHQSSPIDLQGALGQPQMWPRERKLQVKDVSGSTPSNPLTMHGGNEGKAAL
jgi:hypothetical protein